MNAVRVRLITAVSLLAIAAIPATAQAAGGDAGKKLNRALDRIMAAPDSPPGLSVLITRNGHSRYLRRGLADIADGRRPGRRLHFRLASVSKAYSGGVTLALVGRGRLRLDDTVGELLPGLLPKARKVTLAQLLHHTSGLPEYIEDEKFVDLLKSEPHAYRTPRQLVSFVRDQELEFEPGTRYQYSDTDNIVAALMAEKVTGIGYQKLLRRLIFRPLRLRRTSLPLSLRMPSPFLRGYDVIPSEPIDDVTRFINPALAWSSGGMVSTVGDVGRFFRGYVGGKLFAKGFRKIRRGQRRWVKGDSSPPGPGRNRAGLALFRYRTRCGTVFGHTGSFPGYRVFAAASADGRRSVVFVANAQITPDQGSPMVSGLIRKAQAAAVCDALG